MNWKGFRRKWHYVYNTYFKVLSNHLLGGTKENDEKCCNSMSQYRVSKSSQHSVKCRELYENFRNLETM
jgi:hypothetical protein